MAFVIDLNFSSGILDDTFKDEELFEVELFSFFANLL